MSKMRDRSGRHHERHVHLRLPSPSQVLEMAGIVLACLVVAGLFTFETLGRPPGMIGNGIAVVAGIVLTLAANHLFPRQH